MRYLNITSIGLLLVAASLFAGCANQTHVNKRYAEAPVVYRNPASNAKMDPMYRQEQAAIAENHLNLSQAGMGVFSTTF